jgi:hypothetical protein
MPQVASGQSAAVGQYRFRTGASVSTWMSAEQLKEAALRGELTPDSHIQQVGHAEWVPATNVRGLTFPAPSAIAIAPDTPQTIVEPTPATSPSAASSRHPRFANLRDVIAAYLHADIEINVPNYHEQSTARVVAVGADHFELVLESERSRVFIPYGQIRAIWSCETSASATLTYREAHKLTVELERPRP